MDVHQSCSSELYRSCILGRMIIITYLILSKTTPPSPLPLFDADARAQRLLRDSLVILMAHPILRHPSRAEELVEPTIQLPAYRKDQLSSSTVLRVAAWTRINSGSSMQDTLKNPAKSARQIRSGPGTWHDDNLVSATLPYSSSSVKSSRFDGSTPRLQRKLIRLLHCSSAPKKRPC